MKVERRSHYSGNLGREMYFNVYGHAGKPMVVFPSSGGSQDEYEAFGMIDALSHYINEGIIKVYTPQSIDQESWLASYKNPHDMASAHDQYDKYIIHEFVALVRYESNWHFGLIATGCSMGAYHAVNFGLRHPDVFDVVIAQSGVYDVRFFSKDFHDEQKAYYNSPIDYLSNMSDPWFLDHYRNNEFIVSVGQGDWEGPHIYDTKRLEEIFHQKSIPGWFDYWGTDVAHDWVWWRHQIPYFMGELRRKNKL